MPEVVMLLSDRYGMNEEERKKRQAFLTITERDADNVRALRASFAEQAGAFAERFYEHLLGNPDTAALLQDPEQLQHLKGVQATYFAELLEGAFDESYFNSRLGVGLAHQRVGLSPVWYLGAYNLYVQLAFPIFARAFGDNLDKALPRLLSLVKVIFLDIGLALHTYFERSTETLKRHNEELQQALGLYWKSQQREEQLRKLISHEIRGGLAAVITSLEDLADVAGPALDRASADQLANINRRCWSLSKVLAEMLAPTSKTEGPGWVDLVSVFENLAARFGLYAEGRPIRLHLPEHPPRVWGDAAQLREVFANLVSNAVRYLDKGPGQVEVSFRSDGAFYTFCVADNGPGVPKEMRERIFDPFFRGPHTEGKPGGTGLGLYFVRTIVEQAGGRVWVESTPGEGSRFFFTIPQMAPEEIKRSG
jgi:signal transduction histidine kinase